MAGRKGSNIDISYGKFSAERHNAGSVSMQEREEYFEGLGKTENEKGKYGETIIIIESTLLHREFFKKVILLNTS